jgi:hypothetical protein
MDTKSEMVLIVDDDYHAPDDETDTGYEDYRCLTAQNGESAIKSIKTSVRTLYFWISRCRL